MSLTYVQLKQAIQDFTENDATEFTTATGSGKAPIDVCIQFAEMRIFREADVAAYRKTVDVTLSANNQFLDLPQDLYVTRYIKTKTGEFLKEKDQTFIREFSQNDSAGVARITRHSAVLCTLWRGGIFSFRQRYEMAIFSTSRC